MAISMDSYQDGGSVPSLQPEVLTTNLEQPQQDELGSGSVNNEVQLAPWPPASDAMTIMLPRAGQGWMSEEGERWGGMSMAPTSLGDAPSLL